MKQFQGIHVPRTLEELVSSQTTAVIIYDMQAGIVQQIKDVAEIAIRVRTLLQAARASGCGRFSPATCRCPLI